MNILHNNIKTRVMQVVSERINRAQKTYDEREKELVALHNDKIVELKNNLQSSKETLTDELVKEVFNVR